MNVLLCCLILTLITTIVFEAVMTDILNGRHVNQLAPEEPGLYQDPIDNKENPTDEF